MLSGHDAMNYTGNNRTIIPWRFLVLITYQITQYVTWYCYTHFTRIWTVQQWWFVLRPYAVGHSNMRGSSILNFDGSVVLEFLFFLILLYTLRSLHSKLYRAWYFSVKRCGREIINRNWYLVVQTCYKNAERKDNLEVLNEPRN